MFFSDVPLGPGLAGVSLRGGRGGVHFKDQLVSPLHWLSGKLTQTGFWSGVTQERALGWTRYKSVVLVIACEMTERMEGVRNSILGARPKQLAGVELVWLEAETDPEREHKPAGPATPRPQKALGPPRLP